MNEYTDYQEFTKRLGILAAVHGRVLKDEMIQGYWLSLQRHPADKVFQALDQARDESPKWPPPETIHAIISGLKASETPQSTGSEYYKEVGPLERDETRKALRDFSGCMKVGANEDWSFAGGPELKNSIDKWILTKLDPWLERFAEARNLDHSDQSAQIQSKQENLTYDNGEKVPENPPF